jgi:hypothetical protein
MRMLGRIFQSLAFWVFAFILVSIPFMVGSFWLLNEMCSADLDSESPIQAPQPSASENRPEARDKSRYGTPEHPPISGGARSTFNIHAPPINQQYSYSSERAPERKKHQWMHAFMCEAKVADLALGWLTFFLVAVTGGLVFIGVGQERSNRKINRAYLVGGPGGRNPHPVIAGNPFTVIMTIGNYGRTPGILTRVSWGLTDDENIVVPRQCPNVVPREDVYAPDTGIRFYPHVSFVFDPARPIFYGRIEYLDVWNEPHFSIWKHRLHPDGGDDPLGGAYTDWK